MDDIIEDHLQIEAAGNVLRIRVTGKLTTEAYHNFVPGVDEFIRDHQKIRILLELHDFCGWTAGALWQDFKFDLAHWKDIERLAIVGDSKWQEGMAVFCKPFTVAKIEYFTHADLDDAMKWIREK